MVTDANSVFVRVLRRWWVVALIIPIAIGLATWHALSTPDSFRTTILLAVAPDPSLPPTDMTRAIDQLSSPMVINDFANTLSSPRVVQQAKADIQLPADRYSDYDIRVTVEPDSSVLRIAVEGPGRRTTQQLAQAILPAGEPVAREMFPIFQFHSLEAGAGRTSVVSLSLLRTLILAGGVGVGLGILAALWVDSLIEYRRAPRGLPRTQPEPGIAASQLSGSAANEAT